MTGLKTNGLLSNLLLVNQNFLIGVVSLNFAVNRGGSETCTARLIFRISASLENIVFVFG